jgi:HTH-type transcriptional regulator, sugar sensing transcriptional regulator
MKSKLVLKNLDAFGLNAYEAKSYLSLLEKKQLTAAEVSRMSGIPRARVYETLENLMQKGFCYSIPGKIKKYEAADPVILKEKIENKIEKIREEIRAKEKALSATVLGANDIVSRLTTIYSGSRTQNDPLDYIEVIKDPCQVNVRLAQLLNSAEKEILAFTKPPYAVNRNKVDDEQLSREKDSIKRGVINRSIYEIPREPEEFNVMAEEFLEARQFGEQARAIDELPIKMVIFDEKVVLYSLEDPILHRVSLTFMIIQHRSLARLLKAAFESTWEQAHDLPTIEQLILYKDSIIASNS